MKLRLIILLLFSAALTLPAQEYKDFRTPPESARPRVWWHWMDGNISKEGIRADLLWMKRAGIAGFHQFDAGGRPVPLMVEERIPYMSTMWKEAFSYAIHLADSLGLEATIASCPGWSTSGGPWVAPSEGVKKLVWRTTKTKGGKQLSLKLPEPFTTPGFWQNYPEPSSSDKRWYSDIAVLAIPLKSNDKSMDEFGAKVSASGGDFNNGILTDGDYSDLRILPPDEKTGFGWICYEFPTETTIRALHIATKAGRRLYRAEPAPVNMFLQSSNDGETWRNICPIPESIIPSITIDIPETTARFFRLKVKNSGSAGRPFSEFVLYGVTKVNMAQDKAGFAPPFDLQQFPTPATEDATKLEDIIVLTDRMSPDGTLEWEAPAGNWKIIRIGASLTGKTNHPASPEATGLEVDKLDPEAWTRYFRTYLDMYKEACDGMLGERGIRYILNDSYEGGLFNWTETMVREFRSRRGYDLIPWMAALTGEIVENSEDTERFLWDWRKTIGELFVENYDRLNGILESYGMAGRYTESHENGRVVPADGMDIKRNAAIPMSAFWIKSSEKIISGMDIEMSMSDIKESASVSHVFGQKIVAAESFTANGIGGKAYTYSPSSLKERADIAFMCGLNRIVVHDSAHQPNDTAIPGPGLFQYGQWFNRHETWAEQARCWTDYLSRTCYMLQQGKYIADVLVYYGEDNNANGLYGHHFPPIPKGYDFDFINPSGLLEAVRVEKGRLVSNGGTEYSVLYLGNNCRIMSLRVLRRLVDLADSGIPICGTLPEIRASLGDDPEEFARLLNKLSNSPNVDCFSLPDAALKKKGISPDFESSVPLDYVHRKDEDGNDIYWIKNFSKDNVKAHVSLRSHLPYARILDPQTGNSNWVECTVNAGRATIELDLVQEDAIFVVLSPNGEKPAYRTFAAVPAGIISTDWTVRFQKGRGAPDTAFFPRLHSLSEHAEPGIRFFSGTASWKGSVILTNKDLKGAAKFKIDLGEVANIAEVSINGNYAGILWKKPFSLELPESFFKKGKNSIEVRVTNLWPNRIIGDCQEDAKEHFTTTPYHFYDAEDPLLPSGLMGPVTLLKLF